METKRGEKNFSALAGRKKKLQISLRKAVHKEGCDAPAYPVVNPSG